MWPSSFSFARCCILCAIQRTARIFSGHNFKNGKLVTAAICLSCLLNVHVPYRTRAYPDWLLKEIRMAKKPLDGKRVGGAL